MKPGKKHPISNRSGQGSRSGARHAALAKTNHDAAAERTEALRPVFAELAGMSTRAAAAELNRRGIATPTGAKWSAMAVSRVRERLA
jgi:hypothetical protein